jgi:serine/threonine protein kinase
MSKREREVSSGGRPHEKIRVFAASIKESAFDNLGTAAGTRILSSSPPSGEATGVLVSDDLDEESRRLIGIGAPSGSVLRVSPESTFKSVLEAELEDIEMNLSSTVRQKIVPELGVSTKKVLGETKGKEKIPIFSRDGEMPDEPGEVLEVVETATGIPAGLLPSGIWILSNYGDECRVFGLSGTPINPDLEGILVEEIIVKEGVVYKAFSAEGARILGRGGFGIAILVTDRSNLDKDTWEKVVIKIEIKPKADITREGAAHDEVFKEATIGMLLDRVFYRGRVTPSVTRTTAVFQCPHLPPPIGAWKDLTESIWPEGESDNRQLVISNPNYEYLYTVQEFANAGTADDIIFGTPSAETPLDFILSVAFQGLYTLEAFRRGGFIHGDINPNNLAFHIIPTGPKRRRIYFMNIFGTPKERIVAFDPFGRTETANNRYLLKFIDYGKSMFGFRNPGRGSYRQDKHFLLNPNRYIQPPLTSMRSMPPETFMREPTEKDPSDLYDVWNLSSASDLWQFTLILVSLALGKHPFVNSSGDYRLTPPEKFTTWINNHVADHIFQYSHIIEFGVVSLMSKQLWNIASMIGLPGADPQTGEIDPVLKEKLEERYPLLRAFRVAETPIHGPGGWLRERIPKMFGPSLGFLLFLALGWDPDSRPRPGQIILHEKVQDFMASLQPEGGIIIQDPRRVTIREHNNIMNATKNGGVFGDVIEAWSLVTPDISYHVPISKSLMGRGPRRFTKAMAKTSVSLHAGMKEEEQGVESLKEEWSRWMF